MDGISIHPPLAGRDARESGGSSPEGNFNPPAPCGTGLSASDRFLLQNPFQSTRPLRDGTQGPTFVTVPALAKEVYVIVYIKWTPGDKVMVDFHIPIEPYAFGTPTSFAQHVKFYGTNHDGYVCIEARTTGGANFMRLYEARNGSTDVTLSSYCAYMYR